MIAIDNYQLYWLEIMEINMFMATEMAKFDEVNMKERFEVNNGVIFDNNTGLMWMQNPLDKLFTWDEACKIKHEFGGFNDWRLPTIEELISIIDYSKRNPSIDEVFWFVDKKYFWSSSPYVGSTGLAWYVYFGYGSVDYDYRDNAFSVRLVRG